MHSTATIWNGTRTPKSKRRYWRESFYDRHELAHTQTLTSSSSSSFCCLQQWRRRRRQFYRPWTESKNKLCGIRFFFAQLWQLFDQKCGLNCAIIIIRHSNSSSLSLFEVAQRNVWWTENDPKTGCDWVHQIFMSNYSANYFGRQPTVEDNGKIKVNVETIFFLCEKNHYFAQKLLYFYTCLGCLGDKMTIFALAPHPKMKL